MYKRSKEERKKRKDKKKQTEYSSKAKLTPSFIIPELLGKKEILGMKKRMFDCFFIST